MRLLLDFIYTGGAAVPEERLDSFLAGAASLGIRVLGERGLHTVLRPHVPPRPQLGILTPSPWAQAARPPHRRPSPHYQEVRMKRPPTPVKEIPPLNLEEPKIEVKKEEAPESPTNLTPNNGVKLCKLKERRLAEFYRQQQEAETGTDLRTGAGVRQTEAVVKREETASPLQELRSLACSLVGESDTNNNKSFLCGVCGKELLGRPQYTAHCKLHEEARPEQTCTHCGKVFVTRASLKVHMRTHTGEKPFQCLECGKQFSQLRNYKYHRSVHEGTREFAATCPECGKYFNDRGYLSSHMKIHRNRKEYGCEYCGKSFNQRVAYNMHVRIHTGEKPHGCQHCGKSFSRKMLLKQHLRIHTGEKPFSCVVCQKAFADRSNMTLHMRLHSGIKPYSCTVCSKSFTKKHHLKTHMNYHTGVKPYSCEKCGLRFSQSSNMRTHFKKCTSITQVTQSSETATPQPVTPQHPPTLPI